MASDEVVRALFRRLVDDAGLFPPALLSMSEALAAHRTTVTSPHRLLIGRFLCPLSRLDEFAAASGDPRPELGVIVDTLGPDPDKNALLAAATLAGTYLPTSVEVRVPTGASYASSSHDGKSRDGNALHSAVGKVIAGFTGLPDAELYVEFPRGALADWPAAIRRLGAARAAGIWVGAKIRCAAAGDTDAPTDAELAAFVVACRATGVPFKATAGLHHAIRHTRDDGYERHGFLNLLLGCAAALRGAGRDEVAAVLADRDAASVVAGITDLSADEAAQVRSALFVAFGCCDPAEPIADLVKLGLLDLGPLDVGPLDVGPLGGC